MRIILCLVLLILAGCNSKQAELSPLGKISEGPFISFISNKVTSIDTTLTIPFTISDQQSILNCTSSVTVAASNSTLFPPAGISLSGTAPNCSLQLTPGSGLRGMSAFNLQVSDGKNTSLSVFSVRVRGSQPVVVDYLYTPNLTEDIETSIILFYTDTEGDLTTSCTVSSLNDVTVSTPCSCALGICSVGITGELNHNGPGSFRYTVTDQDGVSNVATVNFSIDAEDDAPVPASSTLSLAQGATGILTLNYTDPENDLASACAVSNESNMTVGACSCDGSGVCTVSVTGNAGYSGTTTLDFTVTTNALTSVIGTGSVTFGSGNSAPYIDPIADRIMTGNTTNSFTFTISDSDSPVACGDVVPTSSDDSVFNADSFSLSGTAPNCVATISPVKNAIGEANITFSLSDGSLSHSETFNVKVLGWGQVAYLKPANNLSSSKFGNSVSSDGDAVAVGAFDRNNSSGGVYIFRKTSPTVWEQEDFILGSVEMGDRFGSSVYLSHDTLAVGVSHDDNSGTSILPGTPADDNGNTDSGAVYIYTQSAGNWDQEAYIKASNAGSSDLFGSSVALNRETLAVAAPLEDNSFTAIHSGTTTPTDDNTVADSGAVYIYTRNSFNQWEQQAYIKPDIVDANDKFGHSISLHGNLLAVSAPNESSSETSINQYASDFGDNDLVSNSGAVYVFFRSAGVWTQEAYIKAANAEAADFFGYSVSLEGNKLAVGAPYEDSDKQGVTDFTADNNNSSASGAVYVYKRTGTSWAHEAYIKPELNIAASFFGHSVSLKGETLVIGAYREKNLRQSLVNEGQGISAGTATESGAAYVYRHTGLAWVRDTYLKPSNLRSMDHFGSAVSNSGNVIAVSSPDEDGNQAEVSPGSTASPPDYLAPESGAVYIFENNARLFDVTEVTAMSDDTTIILTWHQTGGTATEYIVATNDGTNPPGPCNLGQPKTSGNTHQDSGLTAESFYTFRVCATDGTNITEGAVITVKTKAANEALAKDVQ